MKNHKLALYLAAGTLAVSGLASCSAFNSAKQFVSNGADAVKNAIIPSRKDTVDIDNRVRIAYGKTPSDSVAGTTPADVAANTKAATDKDVTLNSEPSGNVVIDINNKAMGQQVYNTPADSTRAQDTANAPARLSAINGEWVIMSVFDQDIEGDERPYITFDASTDMFYGSNGCNILNGTVTGDGKSTIGFDNVLSTMKECADAQYQYIINMALPQIKCFTIEKKGQESYMSLRNDKKQTVMILRKNNMGFVNGAWTVTTLDGTDVEAGKITLTIDIQELRVHGNAGCNIINGSLYLDPDKPNSLQFGQMATTRMTCPDIQLEMNFLVALESVESAYRDSDDTITLANAAGDRIMTLKRIEIPRQ